MIYALEIRYHSDAGENVNIINLILKRVPAWPVYTPYEGPNLAKEPEVDSI